MSVTFVTNEDMAVLDGKLDALLQKTNFRVVSGTYIPAETVAAKTTITIPCPAGAKCFTLLCDEATNAAIRQLTDGLYTQGFSANFSVEIPTSVNQYNTLALVWAGNYGMAGNGGLTTSNADGFTVTTSSPIIPGTYNWTAYYWDE